jgi:hypothetical protein
MSYELTITPKAGYLHAVVTGTNSQENVARYLQSVLQECLARNCPRVLIEERLEGPRLGTLGVFEVASAGSEHVAGRLKAVAYVDVHAQGQLMEFAENVAVNRGLPTRVFASVAEAETWLRREASEVRGAE